MAYIPGIMSLGQLRPGLAASTVRNTLELGTAALVDVGTGSGNVVQLPTSGQLPALDGSLLTNISGAGNPFDQDLNTTDSVEFISVSFSGETALHNDGSGVLSQRNGTDSQSFRIYNTDDEWFAFNWQETADVVTVGTYASGSGIERTVTVLNDWIFENFVKAKGVQTSTANGILLATNAFYSQGVRLQNLGTDGKLRFSNWAATGGIQFNLQTANRLDIRNLADSAYGDIRAKEAILDAISLDGGVISISVDSTFDFEAPSIFRTALELGTAAVEDVGTSSGNVVQLPASGQLPALDGSLLTNLPSNNPFDQDLNTTDGVEFVRVDLAGGTVTSSSPLSAATQTWNDGAVAFTGCSISITDTASDTASRIVDYSVDGQTRFAVESSTGRLRFGKSGVNNYIRAQSNIIFERDSTQLGFLSTTLFQVRNNMGFSWSINSTAGSTSGHGIYSDATNLTQIRKDISPQEFRVYNLYLSGANDEYFSIDWQTTSNECLLTTAALGAGFKRPLSISGSTMTLTPDSVFTLETSSVERYTVSAIGHHTFSGVVTMAADGSSVTPVLKVTNTKLSGGTAFSAGTDDTNGGYFAVTHDSVGNPTTVTVNPVGTVAYHQFNSVNGLEGKIGLTFSNGLNFQAVTNMSLFVDNDNSGTGAFHIRKGSVNGRITDGTSLLSISNAGAVNIPGSVTAASFAGDGSALTNLSIATGTAAVEDVGTDSGNVVQLPASGQLPALDGSLLTNLPVGSGGTGNPFDQDLNTTDSVQFISVSFSGETELHNDGSGVLSQRNGTDSQVFRIYNTYDSGLDDEWFSFDWQTTADTLTIGTDAEGSGTARTVTVTNDWHFDNFVKTKGLQTHSANGILVATSTSYSQGVRLQNLGTDGKLRFSNWAATGGVQFNLQTANTLTVRNLADSAAGDISAGVVTADSFVFTAGNGVYSDSLDLTQIRRTTNAQEFRVYNTYTDSSNGEWFGIDWVTSPGTCVLETRANGAGTHSPIEIKSGTSSNPNNVIIDTDSNNRFTFSSTAFTAAANLLASGSRDIGTTGSRWANIYGTTVHANTISTSLIESGSELILRNSTSNVDWGLCTEMYATTGYRDGLIKMRRSKSGTKGSLSTTADTDDFGSIYGYGVDNASGWAIGCGLVFEQDGSAGASHVPGSMTFYTTNSGGTTDVRMRLRADGSLDVTGGITAGSFAGDGSALTNLPIATGTAAVEDVGTNSGNVVQLPASGQLPALDGSLLTNLPGGTGGNPFDQDLNTTDSPTFDLLTTNSFIVESGVVSQRDSTTAQDFRVYNTYDGVDDEYLGINWTDTSNECTIKTEATGAGTTRKMVITGNPVNIQQDRTYGPLQVEQLGSTKTDNIELINPAGSTSWLIGVGVPGQYDGYLYFRKPGGNQISALFLDGSNNLGCGQHILTGASFGAYGSQAIRHYNPNTSTITWTGDTFTWDCYYSDPGLTFKGDAIIFKVLSGGVVRVGINAGTSPSRTLHVNGDALITGSVAINTLATSDPATADELWNDNGTVKISSGTAEDKVTKVDASASNQTVNLSAAASSTDKIVKIKRTDDGSGGYTVTVDANGSETIDGNLTVTMLALEALTLWCDGTEWFII